MFHVEQLATQRGGRGRLGGPTPEMFHVEQLATQRGGRRRPGGPTPEMFHVEQLRMCQPSSVPLSDCSTWNNWPSSGVPAGSIWPYSFSHKRLAKHSLECSTWHNWPWIRLSSHWSTWNNGARSVAARSTWEPLPKCSTWNNCGCASPRASPSANVPRGTIGPALGCRLASSRRIAFSRNDLQNFALNVPRGTIAPEPAELSICSTWNNWTTQGGARSPGSPLPN